MSTTLFTDERLNLRLRDLAAEWSPTEIIEAVVATWPDLLSRESYPARIDDRQTSQDAAARHRTRDVSRFRQGSVIANVLESFVSFRVGGTDYFTPLTALTVARIASGCDTTLSTETARKRVSELVKAGYLRDTGSTSKSEGSPDESTLWTITHAGMQALDNLRRTGWSK